MKKLFITTVCAAALGSVTSLCWTAIKQSAELRECKAERAVLTAVPEEGK